MSGSRSPAAAGNANPTYKRLILEQIIKALLAIVLLVRLSRNSPRLFHHVARLIHIAKIVLVLLDNVLVDILAALVAAGWIKVTAPATTAERGHTVGAFIGTGDFAGYPSRSATVPAYESVGRGLGGH